MIFPFDLFGVAQFEEEKGNFWRARVDKEEKVRVM